MLTGLEILLDRMKTNPEEFLKDGNVPYDGEIFGGKWSDLLDYAWRVGDDEERKALQDAKIAFYRDDFNERVMRRLAGEEVKQEESSMQKFRIKTPAQNLAVSSGGTGAIASMLGQQGAQQATTNSLQAMGSNGYGQAQVRQEGAAIGVDRSFWGGVVSAGKGKLW